VIRLLLLLLSFDSAITVVVVAVGDDVDDVDDGAAAAAAADTDEAHNVTAKSVTASSALERFRRRELWVWRDVICFSRRLELELEKLAIAFFKIVSRKFKLS
jgi:hypothetical protein